MAPSSDEATEAPTAAKELGQRAQTIATVGLFLIALGFVLYLGRFVLAPIAAAVLASFAVQPVLRAAQRRWPVPLPFLAASTVLLLTCGVALATWGVAGPATRWIDDGPEKLQRIEWKLRSLRAPVEQITEAAEKIEELADPTPSRSGPQEVHVQKPSVVARIAESMGVLVFSLGLFVVFLYFLLVSGDSFLRKIVRLSPRLTDKKNAVAIFRGMEEAISRYLITITCINAGLAIAVGLSMRAIGLPQGFELGLMAGLFNFVPYIGPIVGVGITAVVSLIHFPTPLAALPAPMVFGALTVLEGYFLTPWILGRGMLLSPLVVLGGVVLWGAVWGAPGAIMAVPILVSAKVVFDHIDGLEPLGELLGE